MTDVIEVHLKTPTVDTKGANDLGHVISNLERLAVLTAKPFRVRFAVDTAGIADVRREMETMRKQTQEAIQGPAISGPKQSVYMSSLITQLKTARNYISDLSGSIRELERGFGSTEAKAQFLSRLQGDLVGYERASKAKFSPASDTGKDIQHLLSSAQNQIILELEKETKAAVDDLQQRKGAALFQGPEDRKGAARGKASSYEEILAAVDALDGGSHSLASTEKKLAAASGEARTELSAQDQALVHKVKSLRDANTATRNLAQSEQSLAKSSHAATSSGGALLRTVEKKGQISRTFGDETGVTRTVGPGDALTVTTDRMVQLRQEAGRVRAALDASLASIKDNGGSAKEMGTAYAAAAKEMGALIGPGGRFSDLDSATGGSFSRRGQGFAERARSLGVKASMEPEIAYEKTVLKDSVAFHERLEADRWREIQRIRGEGLAKISRMQAEGASPRAIGKAYSETAGDIERIGRGFRSMEDVLKTRGEALDLRNKGGVAELKALSKAEADYYRDAVHQAEAFKKRIQSDASLHFAEDTMSDMKARGFREMGSSTTKSPIGSRQTINFEKDNPTMRENVRLVVERDAKGKILNTSMAEGVRVMKATGEATGYLTKNFLTNTATITAWASSVAVLYGTMNLLKMGMDAAVRYDRRFATLAVVFRGTEHQAAALRDEILSLAVAYGQSGEEALEAGVRFARLGLSQTQTLEAVRASLMAANVAEMPVNEAADQLAAVMATFNLEAKDLVGVINKLNAISNTYNVTNKDMLSGLGRVSSVARQAGLGLEETMGMVAAIVARTGRSGAEAGNAIKSIIVALSNPALQRNLGDIFQFSVTDQAGQLKDMSDIIRELYLRYNELTSAEQSHLLQMTAGKQQASRLAALIDGYVDSQLNAIRSLTNLDSAEKENARIKQSLIVQIQSLATAYERLVYNLSQTGGNMALIGTLRELVTFLRNTVTVMGTFSDQTAIVLGITALFAARLGVTAYRLAAASNQMTFATNTAKALNGALAGLKSTFMTLNREMVYSGTRMATFTRGMIAATGATRALGLAISWTAGVLRALLRAFIIFAALEAVMWAFNKAVESQASGWEKAKQKLAGFNEELERLKSLTEANRLSQRLAATISERLRKGNASPETIDASIAALSEIGSGGDDGRRRQIDQELRVAYQQLGVAGLLVRAEEVRNDLKSRGVALSEEERRANQRNLEESRRGLAAAQAEMERLRGVDPSRSVVRDAEKALQEARQQYNQAAEKSVSSALNVSTDEDSDTVRAEELRQQKASDRYRSSLEAQMKGIQSAWDALSDLGPTDRAQMNMAAVDQQIRASERLTEAQQKEADAAVASAQAVRDSAKAKVDSFGEYNQTLKNITELESFLDSQKDTATGRQVARINKMDPTNRAIMLNGNDLEFRKDVEVYEQNVRSATQAIEVLRQKRLQMESDNPEILQSKEEYSQALQQADSLLASKQEQLKIATEAAAKTREELELRKEALRIEEYYASRIEAITRGKRLGQMATLPLQYGNDTERLLREQRVLTSSNGQRDNQTGAALNIRGAQENFMAASFRGDEKGMWQEAAAMREMALRAQHQDLALLDRKLTLEAQIREEKRRQNQEASRNLLMADRETQLRAAMAKKLQGNRQFNAEDFMFFSQETKQAVQSTTPELMPDEAGTRLQELQREYQQVTAAMQQLNPEVETFLKNIVDFTTKLLSAGGSGGPGGEMGINIDGYLAEVRTGGAAMQTAMQKMTDEFLRQFTAVANLANETARRVGQLAVGDSASRAQAAAG